MASDITGTWVTSFNVWLQNNPSDLLYPFRIANKRFANWTDPVVWDDIWDKYFPKKQNTPLPDNEAYEEHYTLALLNPVPAATLTCFKFLEDKTFMCWTRWNNLENFTEKKFRGDYDLRWFPDFEVAGGYLTLRELDDSVHASLEFFVTDFDEIRFVIAYKTGVDDPAPSGAGTLRRVQDRPRYWPRGAAWPSATGAP